MSISEQVQKDMVGAMKARDERRLSTLRMVKSALKNKEIDKRAPLDDEKASESPRSGDEGWPPPWPSARPAEEASAPE